MSVGAVIVMVRLIAGMYSVDPAYLHGDIGAGPVQDVALTAWAIRNGFGSHWATYAGCGGG